MGSNLGDRRALLRVAIDALRASDGVTVGAVSSVYETDPVGGPSGQHRYLNMVLAVATTLSARALLARCLAIESSLGRDRAREERWGPRAIDIDMLLFGDARIDDDDLTLPHPRMTERAFVLVPLAEIAPSLLLPHGITAADAAAQCARDGVRLVAPAP